MSPAEILHKYWGYDTFRGEQERIIDAVLEGRDTLALLPTGGGKSICFQVPALLQDGLCLVISPLIALMKDQVENLQQRKIAAASINSSMSFYEVKQTLQRAAHGEYRFLYVSPERLQTKLFKEFCPALGISLIAVDEAHCISQWGYDFRPSYLHIGALREEVPDVPVLALTASATPEVQQDIIAKLQLKNAAVFRQSFHRPNLSYSAFAVDSKINKLTEILKNVPGSSVVYCKNRRETLLVAQLLQLQKVSADHYHAGLPQSERSRKQEAWVRGQIRVIVCTNAFGMGIDKPDVRTVVHYEVPDSIENYYQEAGRGGRDGKRSYAVALYNSEDLENLSNLPEVKFPSIGEIKKIYQSLADYLNIPVGLGEGNYYDFDLLEFAQNFKYDVHLVLNTLKALEAEGHLSFSENIFLPAQVNFTAPKAVLEDFEIAHPDLEPLVKVLLRTYEGIYDNRVSVNEKQVARLVRSSVETVQQQLQSLQAFGIIEYLPQKETPQIYFLLNRAPAEFLQINNTAYQHRKQQYADRVNAMLRYIHHEECRSNYIAGYFGEAESMPCGLCDNCLRSKATGLKVSTFKSIEAGIYAHIPKSGIEINALLPMLHPFQKEQIWKVLEFLQAEKKITVVNNKVLLFN